MTGVPRIDEAALVTQKELGVGGQGQVHLVTAPGYAEPMAYKAWDAESRAKADPAVLDDLILLPATLAEDVRAKLATQAAWPVATVHRDGALTGFLMPAAPADFLAYLRLPSGFEAKVLGLEFLLNPVQYMANVNLPVTERQRLQLLRDFAALLRDLHAAEVVVGDLSPKNALVRLAPPGCFLIDIDAVRVQRRSVLPQVETPGWEVPDREETATKASDRYKFALVVLRVLLSDQDAADPAALKATQPGLAALAAQGLGRSTQRPDLDAWLVELERALPTASNEVPTVRLEPAPPPVTPPTAYPQPSYQQPAYPPVQPPPPIQPPPPAIPYKPPRRRRRGRGVFIALMLLACCLGGPTLWNRIGSALAEQAAADAADPKNQAAAVQTILNAAKNDRENLVGAVDLVSKCRNLSSAVSQLQQVTQGRRAELSRAQALSLTALANGTQIASSLVTALQHSVAADVAYLAWAQKVAGSCSKANLADHQRTVGDDESKAATTAKKQFVAAWNPVAQQYGYATIAYTDV
ncbi:MAG: hypothetical protein HOV83_32995 [Catenulispora sp.]|nr:hypothetical protein [Catenulispora sp.]